MVLELNKNKNGFTLIELLVVIAIIGLLSSVVMASLNTARSKARDSRRLHDLDQIRTALNFYYDANGNWIETNSGCGYIGDGNGWFNRDDGVDPYPDSILQCLVDAGLIENDIIDPTGGITSTPTTGFAYMKYSCGGASSKKVYLYAKLEEVPQSPTALDGTCCSVCDSSYGMNYYLKVQ